jgi:predicted transcriptional regulator YdeE
MVRALILVAILGLTGAGLAGGRSPETEAQANDPPRTPNDETENAIHRINISGFTIIGIEARTTNAKEAAGNGIIPQQWQKFFSEGIPDKIPNKIESNFYAVYSDYASDHNGEYSYVIGAKVKEGTPPPGGMGTRRVPAGEYAIITSDKGPFPRVVPAAWQKIFTLEGEGKLKRAYQTDFEIYDQRAQDPQNGQIDIYIGLK